MSEKAYEYMMDSLRKIISFVEGASEDWWWFERGKIPVVSVHRLEVGGKVSLEYMPKRPILDALKIIHRNFELIKDIPAEERGSVALKLARDLYLVLQAVSYIIDAHEVAEELVRLRNRIEKMDPSRLEEFIDSIDPILKKLREILAANIFSWPKKKNEIESYVKEIVAKFGMVGSKEKISVEPEKSGGVEA